MMNNEMPNYFESGKFYTCTPKISILHDKPFDKKLLKHKIHSYTHLHYAYAHKFSLKYDEAFSKNIWKPIGQIQTNPKFTNWEENIKKKNSKIPLVLSIGIISTMMSVAYLGLPSPYNYMAILAMAGPLSASFLGLRR